MAGHGVARNGSHLGERGAAMRAASLRRGAEHHPLPGWPEGQWSPPLRREYVDPVAVSWRSCGRPPPGVAHSAPHMQSRVRMSDQTDDAATIQKELMVGATRTIIAALQRFSRDMK